jgi:ribosome-associated toxin RatA of RatAB toxin-antitoxin module
MPSANATDVFSCTAQEFYKIVSDYESYPKFLPEVKECKILKTEGSKKLVEYKVSLMKSFKYALWTTENPESFTVSWVFASGDLFRTMSGSWKIIDEGGKARATYSVDGEFAILVPGPIAKTLLSVNLPTMMSSYQKRVSQIYGR